MSAASQAQCRHASGALARAAIYAVLILFAVYYLLPLYVMLVNSLKPLDEIRQGNMLALPHQWTIEPWLSAWSTAQIGVQPTGLRPLFPELGADGGAGGVRSRPCSARSTATC